MKLLKTICWFFFLLTISGCSWIERFMVVNESDEEIEITYTLVPPEETFAIFDNSPESYALKKKGQIDWDKKLEINDLDTSFQTVYIQLPPKTLLVFGSLHNDNYTSYDQYFINGRSFNLVEMTITTKGKTQIIKPESFDEFFHKKNGSVSFVVK
ncbi:MAG: hypothetical protein AB7O47_00770 [Flavobacteriales bacterium]